MFKPQKETKEINHNEKENWNESNHNIHCMNLIQSNKRTKLFN